MHAERYHDPTVRSFLENHGHESAAETFSWWQVAKFFFWASCLVVFWLWDWKIFLTAVNGAVCAFYMVVILYKLLTVALSIIFRPELKAKEGVPESELPTYTVLVPLYKEREIADKIVSAALSLDYPREKLDVKLLLEEDDDETRRAVEGMDLPGCVEVVIVPKGLPRTKPRACNHGLERARGEFLVIYDAEDRPDRDQLKKAVSIFRQLERTRKARKVVCLQAKLNYYNPRQNWLTKFFTLEYTQWFDLFLPGLHVLGVPIPLGGTSNHFRTDALRELGGWDPFNVAEDCDLGMRLYKKGYRTAVFDSTTWEEANSDLGNWIRQRSRWVKGYVQTHLVHTREWFVSPVGPKVFRPARVLIALLLLGYAGVELVGAYRSWDPSPLLRVLVVWAAGGGALWLWGFLKGMVRLGPKGHGSFLLTVGGLSAMLLLNPIYWAVGACWLFRWWQMWYERYTDELRLHLDPWSVVSHIFWYATIVLLAANAVFILINLIACSRRKLFDLTLYALLAPFYWVVISIGAWKGFLQLFTRAHHWEKTQHGLTGRPSARSPRQARGLSSSKEGRPDPSDGPER